MVRFAVVIICLGVVCDLLMLCDGMVFCWYYISAVERSSNSLTYSSVIIVVIIILVVTVQAMLT